MYKLKTRRLVGLTSLLVLLGAVYFVAYGAVITCAGGACVGTNANDIITGTAAVETIYGLGGDDVITDGGGAFGDLIFAGPGNDRVTIAGTASATVFGQDGNDFISVTGAAAHSIDGGRGHDVITLTVAADGAVITDGTGRDLINNPGGGDVTVLLAGDNEPDTVQGGDGDDTIVLNRSSGRDVIDCGGGTDTVFLNGNSKAVDPFGNNLRRIALLGGGTATCETIIP